MMETLVYLAVACQVHLISEASAAAEASAAKSEKVDMGFIDQIISAVAKPSTEHLPVYLALVLGLLTLLAVCRKVGSRGQEF